MDLSAKSIYDQVMSNLAERKNLDETIAMLDSLLADNIDPTSANYLLGNAYTIKSHFAIAEQFFLKANELRPKNASIINALGCSAMELLRHHEAIDRFNESLALVDDPIIYNNLATCYVHLGEPAEGLKWAEKAVKGDPDNAETKQNLAQCLLGIGDYKRGFEYYDSRLQLHDHKERVYAPNPPVWDGTKGINLLVHGEQGLGDEIMFASMLPDVMRDCNIIYDCNSRLVNIMRDSFPGIPIYGTKQENGNVEWLKNHTIDAKISIGSLAKFYRNSEKDFPKVPYLKANEEIIEKYRNKLDALGKRPKIGISWYGGVKRTSQSYRFNPLANWLDILRLDCDFISLQYNAEAGEKIARFNAENGTNIIHWPEMIADYDETAGLLMNLDLVISAPQSVVHLAGALGVSCWRLAAKQSLWTHGVHGKDSPWYGTVKNYWQDDNGEWSNVMKRVKEDLMRAI